MINRTINLSLTLLGVGFIIFQLFSYLLYPMISRSISVDEHIEMRQIALIYGTIQNFIIHGFNLLIGVFLVFQAIEYKLNKMLWFLTGAVFGFNALILFYILLILNKKKPEYIDKDILDN